MSSLSTKIDTHDKGIKSTISSSQDTITNAIIGVNNHITQQGTTLEDKIDAKGCIKSIQRFGGSFLLKDVATERTCNPVDTNKTLIYIVSGSTTGIGCNAILLSSTKVLIAAPDATSDTDGHGYFNIQLIEFY